MNLDRGSAEFAEGFLEPSHGIDDGGIVDAISNPEMPGTSEPAARNGEDPSLLKRRHEGDIIFDRGLRKKIEGPLGLVEP